MARDLIPPPSPAGRPTSPGTPNLIELPPEPPRSGTESAQVTDLPPSEFRNRFGFVMGALGGVVLAVAIVVVIAVTSGGSDAREGFAPNWSRWQPPQKGDLAAGAEEIAQHVGAEYKQDNGSQLAMVKGQVMPGVQIAVRPTTGAIQTITPSHGIIYTVNGLGQNGALTGKPSLARGQLIRREALELALYTFRYLPDVDSVVTLLPTIPRGAQTKGGPTTQPQSQAVFYRPGDLKQQLQTPLRFTLASKSLAPATIGAADGRKVDALTLSNLFVWSIQRAQTGEPYLVLDRARTG